jgi:adenylylsulfate kinase
MVIWLTGLSGAGKSTLCEALYARLKPLHPCLVKLDGDEIRAAFGGDLGHAEADRVRQIGRVQGLARILAEQKIDVLVAALYANPELLEWNRANLPGYFEIYLRSDVAFLSTRDGKGLYGRAQRGEMKDVVGVDIPWREPVRPDMVIDAASAPSPDVLSGQVIAAIGPRLSRAGGAA